MEMLVEYKCRRCGEIYRNGLQTGTEAALILARTIPFGIPTGLPVSGFGELKMYGVHHCEDRGIGISDWVGYSKIE